MSGVKRLRQAKGQPILQEGPKTTAFIMPNPQTDMSGFGKRGQPGAETQGGSVKAPKKSNPLTLPTTNDPDSGFERYTPPPTSNERPTRGEHPRMTRRHSMMNE